MDVHFAPIGPLTVKMSKSTGPGFPGGGESQSLTEIYESFIYERLTEIF